MCVVMGTAGILAGALQVAAAGAAYYAQQEQAKSQVEYQERLQIARNEQIRQNQELTLRAYNDQLSAVNARKSQEQATAAQKALNVKRETERRKGTAQVAAGEAGVTGVSRDLLMSEYDRTASEWNSSLQQQLKYGDQATHFQLQGLQAQAEGRAQSIQPYVPTPVNFPSPFAAALQVGSGALYGHDRYQFYSGTGPYNPQGPSPSV